MMWFKKKKIRLHSGVLQATPAAKALYVSDYLTPDRIRFCAPGATKQEFLEELVLSLPYSRPDIAFKAILEREKIGSTVIGPGLALPHARLIDVPDIQAALGVCPGGVVADKPEEGAVRLFLLFLGPQNYMKKNLDFLASVSALFQMEELPDSILRLTNPEEILSKIREAEQH